MVSGTESAGATAAGIVGAATACSGALTAAGVSAVVSLAIEATAGFSKLSAIVEAAGVAGIVTVIAAGGGGGTGENIGELAAGGDVTTADADGR
jgi:hypothetical protein